MEIIKKKPVDNIVICSMHKNIKIDLPFSPKYIPNKKKKKKNVEYWFNEKKKN